MRHYLSTIHTRSDSHKKKFALLTSAGVTLAIFAIWSLVNFGSSGVVAEEDRAEFASEDRVSPFKFVGGALSASFAALGTHFNEAQKGLQPVETGGEQQEVPGTELNSYGE